MHEDVHVSFEQELVDSSTDIFQIRAWCGNDVNDAEQFGVGRTRVVVLVRMSVIVVMIMVVIMVLVMVMIMMVVVVVVVIMMSMVGIMFGQITDLFIVKIWYSQGAEL